MIERRRGGFTAKDLVAAFGRSGSVSGRADTLVRTAGLATSAHGFRCGPDLLIGRVRGHLVRQRDLLDQWATLASEGAQLRSELGLAPSLDDVRPAAPTGMVHRLKVTLTGTKPPLWRRLVVPSDVTLGDLHEVLQAAFEWSDTHLHEFEVGGRRYVPADDPLDDWGPSIGPPTVDEETVTLATVARAGDRFTYTYDFGDDWRHRIEVEAVSPPEEGRSYPGCLGGRRAAPPEDIGGPPGFESFLAALAALGDPTHGRYDDRYGGPFDPTDFDVDELDEFLGSLRFD